MSNMEKHLFNLKFAAKDLERNAKKSEKAEKEEKTKLKKEGYMLPFMKSKLKYLIPTCRQLFTLKYTARSLARLAVKCDKEERAEKRKLKKAIQKGNLEGARIHAENSIRQKNQALNYRRMSARIDAVAARVQTAVTMKQVTKSMGGVVKSMESAMKSMDLEKISQLMDRFEQQFENLDVQSQVMEDTMSASSTLNTPQTQVEGLMQEVADEAGLELNMDLPAAQGSALTGVASSNASHEQDELTQRLAKLRN